MGADRVTAAFVLPVGWSWIEESWHPSDDPIWKSYRMARHEDGRLANFESRNTVTEEPQP